MTDGLFVFAQLCEYGSQVQMRPCQVQLLTSRVLHFQFEGVVEVVEGHVRLLSPIFIYLEYPLLFVVASQVIKSK